MPENYDYAVAVIGGGPGGYVAAIRATQLGARTCLIEKADLGGVCTNAGCIPTKALWHSARVMLEVERAPDFGIMVDRPPIDFEPIAGHRDSVVKKLRAGVGSLLKANKVDVIRGAAAFKDPHTLTVEGEDGAREVTAEKVFIATGSAPIELPNAPFDHEVIRDSWDALHGTELPESLIIIGGGYIGVEFACINAAYGVNVTLVEAMDTLLPGVDPDCVKLVVRDLKKRGASIHTGAKLDTVEKTDGGVTARLTDGTEAHARKMLVFVGRRPDCTGLAIENAGLEPGTNGEIPVNEHMQTRVPHVYAIGDVCGGPLLAHVASQEGVVAAAHATGTITAAMDYRVVPACVFAFPEIAMVGISEQQAAEQSRETVVKKFPFMALGKAHVQGEPEGFVKMIADAGTGQLLGVNICGPDASVLLGEATLAVQLGCTAEELAHTIHAHPTMPEALREAAEGIMGMPINWRG